MARYTHTVDAKGRVFVPARVRADLGASLVIARSLDRGYLVAYTPERFRSIREQIGRLSGTGAKARRFQRRVLADATVCELDAQGRIQISDDLWSLIDVRKGDEICFIDLFDKLEICSRKFYDEARQEEEAQTGDDFSEFYVEGL